MKSLLLLSTSTVHGSAYLEYAVDEIKSFLRDTRTVLFLPYARTGGISHDDYTERTRRVFERMGFGLVGIQETQNPITAVEKAEAVFVGGGNTFVLLRALYMGGILHPLREVVLSGTPYLGSSAGSNVAGPTIGTTNDMPVVRPPAFEALGLVPFNLNPHYLDPDPASTHMGETRETRIREFHVYNPQPVLALREGAMVRVERQRAKLLGTAGGVLFRRDQEPSQLEAGADLSKLFNFQPRFGRE